MITAIEAALLMLILVTAIATMLLRDLLSAIIAFAAYSLALAVLWLMLRAPDVALTEAAIGAGITTIFLIVALTKTVRPSPDRLIRRVDPRSAVTVILLTVALSLTLPAIPAIGDPTAPAVAYDPVTPYYLENAYDQTGVHNVVTAVLAAYRGFDTLGEAVVVFTAGVAVLIVLREESFL